MGTYVSTNILMHFTDKAIFDEVVNLINNKPDGIPNGYHIDYDKIEYELYSEAYRKCGVKIPLPDEIGGYDNINISVINGYNSLGDLKKYAPVYGIPKIDHEKQTVFLSFHSSRGHYKTCEYILDVLADQYIRYSCDEDGGKSLSYSLERDGLDPYIGAFKDVVDLKSMNYVKEDDEYVWGYR